MQRYGRRDWFPEMKSITLPDSSADSSNDVPMPWLENLLALVNSSFFKGTNLLCLACKTLMHSAGEHSRHDHFGIYNVDNFTCVRKATMIRLNVDVVGIQFVHHAGDDYIHLHNTYGYFLELESTGRICIQCNTRLLFVEKQTRFCCLDCKYRLLNGEIRSSKKSSPLLPIASRPIFKPKDGPSYKDATLQ